MTTVQLNAYWSGFATVICYPENLYCFTHYCYNLALLLYLFLYHSLLFTTAAAKEPPTIE